MRRLSLKINRFYPPLRIFLGDKYPGVYLTRREAQYALQSLKGKKRAEIALDLQISIRTLDSYIESIKIKLGCLRSREIRGLIQQTDFLKIAENALTSR